MLSICKNILNQLRAQNKSAYITALVHKPYVRTIASLKNDDTENIFDQIDDLSHIELTSRLKAQGLLTRGSKSDLVARLKSPNENDYPKIIRIKRLKNDNAEDVSRSIDDLTYKELTSRLDS
jgi:Glu-tRNA(Gln) amidotransferase subunit E-like FAD-binding protein